MGNLLRFLILLLLCNQFSACLSTERISLFYSLGEKNAQTIPKKTDEQLIDQTCILKINVNNLDPQSITTINSNNINGTYLINDSGNIDFPFLGEIKVVGKTKNNIKHLIEEELIKKKIGITPIVNVSISNFHITVLGEVNKPGVIPIVDEQITLSEAIGMAGDLTPYGRRHNVLLIRELNGKRTFKRINLNDSNLFEPQYFNLSNRDVIYVEPNFVKTFNSSQSRAFLGFLTGILTLTFLFTRF